MSRSTVLNRGIRCGAGLSVGAAAGLVIVDPGSHFAVSWFGLGDEPAAGWVAALAAAPGFAVLAAAAGALAVSRARRAWAVAAAALAGVLIAASPVLTQVLPQVAQRYAVVGLAGLALGAAAAAVWSRRGDALCLLLGAAAPLLLADSVSAATAFDVLPRRLAEYIDADFALTPWWWLLGAAAVLALAAAVVSDEVAEPPDRRIAAGAALVTAGAIVSYELAQANSASWSWAVGGALLGLATIAAAAWLLPGRDGRFLWAAITVSAVAAPLLIQVAIEVVPAVILLLAAAGLAAGGYLGARWPTPAPGLAGLGLIAALGAVETDTQSALTMLRLLALALAAGHLLAATAPARAGSGAVGAAALFVPFAWASMASSAFTQLWFAYTPTSQPAFLTNEVAPPSALAPAGVSAAIVAVVLAAGAGMAALARSRRD